MSTWKGSSKKRKRVGKTQTAVVNRSSSGRVHLVLHKDAQGRVAAASLSEPLFSEDWQNTLSASAANTALQKLRNNPNPASLANLAQEAMDALSKFVAGLLTQPDAPAVACAEGCAHCCHQSVGVTPLEAIALVGHLRATRSADELTTIATRVQSARERTQGLSTQQRFSPDYPCPLLENNRCSVYSVRPLSCRATNSLDAERCRTDLYDGVARARFLASGKGPDSLLGPFRASHALSAGLQLCLSEVYGFDMQPLDLTRALDELLQKPGLAEQWLETGRGLESARGGDGSSNPHLLHVAGIEHA